MSESVLLHNVPLFAAFSPADLEPLAARVRRRRFGRGDVVFLKGDAGTSLYMVESGRVKLGLASPDGREVLLDLFGPGDVFGELALLDGEPRSADAVTIEPTVLLLLQREDFVHYVMEQPNFAIQVMTVLGRRLRRDADLVQDAAFLDVPARLARTILRLVDSEDDTDAKRPLVTPKLTQSDLAGLAGTTRETLNKWLGFFEEHGLIRWDKGQITVLDVHKLRRRTL